MGWSGSTKTGGVMGRTLAALPDNSMWVGVARKTLDNKWQQMWARCDGDPNVKGASRWRLETPSWSSVQWFTTYAAAASRARYYVTHGVGGTRAGIRFRFDDPARGDDA